MDTVPRRAVAPSTVHHRLSTPRRVLRAVAVVACVPYLTLKIAWLGGSRIGIPQGSTLRNDGDSLMALNGLTVVLDAAVIVLAFALTRPWGLRIPAWLMALPVWVATGLIGPILVAFPVLTLGTVVAGGDGPTSHDGDSSQFLASWVSNLVYTGFIVQGLALGTLFLCYARDRWGHLLRGPVSGLPLGGAGGTGNAQRATAVAAALLALLPLTMHLLWAGDADTGLSPARIAGQDTTSQITEATFVAFTLFAVAGALALAFRLRPGLPLRVPFALTWAGSGTLACWGGWMILAEVTAAGSAFEEQPTRMMTLTYAVQLIAGLLIAVFGARLLAEHARQDA